MDHHMLDAALPKGAQSIENRCLPGRAAGDDGETFPPGQVADGRVQSRTVVRMNDDDDRTSFWPVEKKPQRVPDHGLAADVPILFRPFNRGSSPLATAGGHHNDPDCSAQLLLHRPAWSMTHFLRTRALSAQDRLFQHLHDFLSMGELCLLASQCRLSKNNANALAA